MSASAIVRPDRRDAWFVLLCLLVIAAGAAVGKLGFFRAFPEASIDFRVTRDQARAVAEKALAARGFETKGFRALVAFDGDDEAKTFLERTLGLAKANPVFGTTVPIWRWSVRFVRPFEKLEYVVWVAPTGEILAFRRLLPEKDAAPDPGEAGARARAEEALRGLRDVDPAALRFVEATTEKRPARVDRTFVWESRTVRYGEAALRYLVEVQGDRVGRSTAYLEVPQDFKRAYGTLRSKNEAAGAVATLGLFLTFAAVLVVFVERLRRRDVKWKTAMVYAGIGLALQLLAGLNELPARLFWYPTSESWTGFLVRQGASVLGGALLVGLLLALLVAGGEPPFREAYPRLPALPRLFSRHAFGTRRFFRGLLLGWALTAAFLAYQVVFYIAAEKLGAWAPADIPYSSLLGTAFPWLGVLVMGFLPATTEEFSSRMFSIPFLSRFAPLPVAIAVPALIWGFAHSAYPNQPFYIRGVELTVVGVVMGLVMLREGLLPLLVWHFTIDALYTSLLLLRSSSTYFVVSGALAAFVLLLPLLLAAALAVRRGGFLPEEEITNAAIGSAPEPERRREEAPSAFAPPAPLVRPWVGALLGGALLLLAATFLLPRSSLRAEPTFGRDRALALADAEMRRRGDDPARYRSMATAGSALPSYEEGAERSLLPYGWSDDAASWLLQRGGLGTLRRWAGGVLPGAVWQVRYVRELEEHGAWVALDAASGRVVGWKRSLPDAEKGARLEPDEARARADALLSQAGLDPAGYTVVSQKAIERKERRDHRVVYESRAERAGGAARRVVAELAGERPSLLASAVKLPEEFERRRARMTPVTYVAVAVKVLGFATLLALAIVELVRAARRGAVRWRAILLPALLLSLPAVAERLVSLPLALRLFRPELSFLNLAVVVGVGQLVGAALSFAFALVALAFVTAARPDAFSAFRRGAPGGGRALLAAAGAALVVLAAARYGGNLLAAFPAAGLVDGLAMPPGVDTLFPAAVLLASATRLALLLGLAASLSVLLTADFLAARVPRFVAFALFAGMFAPLAPRTLPELLVPWLEALLVALALLASAAVLLRDDPRAYVLAAALITALRGGAALASSGVASWNLHGWLAFGLAAGLALLVARPSGGVGTKTE